MNAYSLARDAYAGNSPIRTERNVEYQAIARVTSELEQYKSAKGADFVKRVEALERNRRLWSILGNDVSSDDNGLPEALRAQIYGLSHFVQTTTPKVLDGKTSIEPLIEINTALLKGLRGETGN